MKSTHKFTESFPRGTWPVYTCDVCGLQKCPTMGERRSDTQPDWWTSPCKPREPLSADDIAWLTGTGRFSQ